MTSNDASATLDWTAQMLEQLTFHWDHQARPRLEGLTDHEYHWEPAPGAWGIRPRAEARAPMAAGGGDLVADFTWPEPVPPPVWSPTAVGALAQLDDAYAGWIAGVAGLTPERLAVPVGEAEGPYAALPYAALVLHIHREAIHHLAEIALLRDLYRATGGEPGRG